MRTVMQIMTSMKIRLDKIPRHMTTLPSLTQYTQSPDEVTLIECARMILDMRSQADKLNELADGMQDFIDGTILLEQDRDESKYEEPS